ncbi:AbiJ-NTD4 domain-containing protein [Sulfitobacter sp. 1A12057]|uniref:AbiJ-NTD4 domain-containing protein n=1 Tax=Sulfitobacter sp. 1A12057 TaxID=3368567 RepID=UPI00374635D5
MSHREVYTPFSQRNGLKPMPPQLKLGAISDEQRLLLHYAVTKEIDNYRSKGVNRWVDDRVAALAQDVHVKVLRLRPADFSRDASKIASTFEPIISKRSIGEVYDLIEFIVRHPNCSTSLVQDISDVFKETRSAYRLVDGQIIAIGNKEQADAVERALAETVAVGALASRRHLILAAKELRTGRWSDSVRESIHSVEAIALRIEPSAKTLGAALATLERSGYIHGSLKDGFKKLYGYTNDEDGIRHALSEVEARVDETDALFMLGACASFVSYLIAREKLLQ